MGGCGIKQVHPIPQHHAGSCPCFHSGWPLPGGRFLPLLYKWGLPRCLWLLHLLGSGCSISWTLPKAATAMICPLPKPVTAWLWRQLAGRQMRLDWRHRSPRLSGSPLGAVALAGGQGLLQVLLQLLPAIIQAVLHLLVVRRRKASYRTRNKARKKLELML